MGKVKGFHNIELSDNYEEVSTAVQNKLNKSTKKVKAKTKVKKFKPQHGIE